jgi:hypothetical protein
MASSSYALVNQSLADTTNLTEYTIPDGVLAENTIYNSRVRYTSNSNPAINSPYSDFSQFKMKSSFLPEPGDAFGGGFFGGQVNISGTIYNLIVAPRTSGGLQGQYGGDNPNFLVGSNSAATQTSYDPNWGGNSTQTQATGGAPFAQFIYSNGQGPNAGNNDVTNTVGTGIGGFNDWYVGSIYEMQVLFYYLKPGAGTVSTNANWAIPIAVSPMPTTASGYSIPQTSIDIFKEGGSQAWATTNTGSYWTSTSPTSIDTTYNQRFDNSGSGGPGLNNSSQGSFYVRGIRREAA